MNTNMKRKGNVRELLSLLLAVLLVVSGSLVVVSAEPTASGTCNDNLTWVLENGTLTVSGQGEMRGDLEELIDEEIRYGWEDYADQITAVVVQEGVKSIGYYAFDDCTGLKNVTIPKSVTHIKRNAFEGCTGLTGIAIPDGVAEIESDVFANCTGLASVTISDSVKKIGEDAFANTAYYNDASNWENDVLYMGSYLLDAKESISGTYHIKEGTSLIAEHAFTGCTGLTGITIPDDIKRISGWTFDGCTGLTNVMIPDSVMEMGYAAFRGCTGLTSITIPDSVTGIEPEAFSRCTGLTSITIPDSVTSIGLCAFDGCTGLTSVSILGNGTSIGDDVFANCTRLANITISDGVASIGVWVFRNTAYYNNKSNWENDVLYIGNYLIEARKGLSGKYSIKQGTSLIASRAFDGCTRLTSVTIPDSVNGIGRDAFYDCTGLTNITIPDSITSIGRDAFRCAYYDNESNWENNVLYIGNYLINATRSISGNYRIKERTSLIADGAFSGCSELTSIMIPDSVTSIGEGAFYYCTALTGIAIPDGVTGIGDWAFYYCTALTSVTIPDSVTSIGEGAFSGCDNLTICGSKGSYAETYAKENGIPFREVGSTDVPNNAQDNPTNVTADNGLVVYSDYTNLSIRKGSTITLSVGIFVGGELTDDVSGITFQIDDTSVLGLSTTDIKDNCRYVKLKGLTEGTTTVVFNDSNTGYSAKIPVTVYENNYLSYTLNSVPTKDIEKYPTNVYNFNGLYIDSYKYTVNEDQSATVSFDVYNTNYSYGAVEVYYEDGHMSGAVLIEKMTSNNTSIKEAVWDNVGCLVRDAFDGDFLSYRQESGYSKKTSVIVEIPKNGYIKISTDPEKSLIVGLVNSVDSLMSIVSLAGDLKDFDVNSGEFSKKLTTKLLADQVYAELIRDGSDAAKDLWKNVGKEIFMSSESMGNFADTIAKNIDELNLGSIIADTAADFGWDVGEDVFTSLAGPAGTALNVLFTIGKAGNLIIQQNNLIHSLGVGSIFIQNQGGGLRSCQQIKVETEDEFSSDTALNVFTVTLDSALLDIIQSVNPEIHEAIKNGVTHTYNISLVKNGSESQPNGKVTVYIPIPEDLKVLAYAGTAVGEITGKVKIYRVEENGGLTEMNVKIEDGCFVFTTDHFSLYTIVGYDSGDDEIQKDKKTNILEVVCLSIAVFIAVGIVVFIIYKSIHKRKKAGK